MLREVTLIFLCFLIATCSAQFSTPGVGTSNYKVEIMKGETMVYYFDYPANNSTNPYSAFYWRVVFSGMASDNHVNVGMYPYPVRDGCVDQCGCQPDEHLVGCPSGNCCVNGYNQGIDFYFSAANHATGPGIWISCLDAPGCCGFASCQFYISWSIYYGSEYNPNTTAVKCFTPSTLNSIFGCGNPMLVSEKGGKAIGC